MPERRVEFGEIHHDNTQRRKLYERGDLLIFDFIRKMRVNGWVVLSVSFLVCLASLCPTIYPGDSSVMAAASFSLGSAHPPGYPLFVILGKLMTFLPFGNVAFKVNLVSALFGALACLMVYKTSMELTENRAASWAAALICGISPLFFSSSLNAKGGVYTLNSFFAICVFYLGIKIIKGKDVFRNSLLAFFLIGLGMGNHHTIGFMGIIILLPIAMKWRELSVKWMLFGLLFFLSGFSVYLFLYLRSLAFTYHGGLILYSYAGTFGDFVRVFLREAYKASSADALQQAFYLGNAWFNGLRNSAYYVAYRSVRPVVVFLLIGLIGLVRQRKLLAYFIFSVIVWLLLLGRLAFSVAHPRIDNVEVVSVYFLPVVPILYCLISVGFAGTISFLRKRQWLVLGGFAPYALAALPFVFLPYSIGQYGLSRNFICYDYGRDMLMSLPEKSLLMNHADNPIFTAFYMKDVERLREDVLVMDTAGKKDVFGLECSPGWKYDRLYPGFYHSLKSTIWQINDEFALKGRLFVDSSSKMTNTVARFYNYYPYLFSDALWPKKLSVKGFEADTRRRFKSAYVRTNYESALAAIFSGDSLVRELLIEYSLNTLYYSDFIMRDGNLREGEIYQTLAFIMAPPQKVLWPYIDFLLKDGRKDHAFSLLTRLKKSPKYGEVARTLENRTLSVISSR